MKKKYKDFFKSICNKEFLISVSCLMVTQEIIFYFIKFFQSNYHYLNSIIDDKIPFIPYFVYIYNIFYPFVFLIFYYIFGKDKKTYYKGISAGIIGVIISSIIFYTYPTMMIRENIDAYSNTITGFILYITYLVDTPALNCFPSIHCLFCFLVIFTSAFSKNVPLNNKLAIFIISFLIIISTVLVKQHYFYDILGALLVLLISYLIVYIFKLDNIFENIIKKSN